MNKKNHWIVNEWVYYASWGVVFRDITISIEELKEFVNTVVLASKEYQIAEVKAALGKPENIAHYVEHSEYGYLNYIDEIVQQHGLFPFFKTHRTALGFNLNSIVSRVCFYNQHGDIEIRSTDNAGYILREIQPKFAKNETSTEYTSDVPPIHISCGFLDVQNGNINNNNFYLGIYLHSDIWFPSVLGLSEEGWEVRDYKKSPYDNSELANCHTPRLNRFLSVVRHASLTLGAKWVVDPDIPIFTKHMVTETGITLNT